MNFEWSVQMENESEIITKESSTDEPTVSTLVISIDKHRTYRCVANNSVGIGTTCSLEINGTREK